MASLRLSSLVRSRFRLMTEIAARSKALVDSSESELCKPVRLRKTKGMCRRALSTSLPEGRKFELVPGNAEWPEEYMEGGYHPIHLGDVLGGKYRIESKLGNGRCATVWLAERINGGQYAALKVLQARDSAFSIEACLLEELTKASVKTRRPLVQPFVEAFDHTGSNGVHSILAMEPLGQTLKDYVWLSEFKVRNRCILKPPPDIQLGNFMFALQRPISKLCQERPNAGRETFSLQRTDGKPLDEHSPSYMVEPESLEDNTVRPCTDLADRLVLTDFGAATRLAAADDDEHAYPNSVWAPEILLGLPINERADIWALGCTIFRLVTSGEWIFVDQFLQGQEQTDEQLQSMIEVLGPMPKHMVRS
ncbi:Protein kinase dsk1 [Elsinoe australis]|uniref:non-specific serine/threonine protein kinase n=1 Tax=Elsinoe australis TaxID=40998 RepID=A0A2P7Z1Y5_9PEZI|nr:Protein kinase dsk1 [Elsinoe australis]